MNFLRSISLIALSLTAFLNLTFAQSTTNDPFDIDTDKELIIYGIGALLGTTAIIVNDNNKPFGGRGYIEKDWGQAFPRAWIWTQSNHFGADAPGTSLTAWGRDHPVAAERISRLHRGAAASRSTLPLRHLQRRSHRATGAGGHARDVAHDRPRRPGTSTSPAGDHRVAGGRRLAPLARTRRHAATGAGELDRPARRAAAGGRGWPGARRFRGYRSPCGPRNRRPDL